MYKYKLCLGLSKSFGVPFEKQIEVIKNANFDAIFFDWEKGIDCKEIKRLAEEAGLEIQSVHAPFANSAVMWESPENATEAVDELLECLEDCVTCGAPIMVMHTFIGFDDTKHSPNTNGYENYGRVVDKAAELGIKIAFENTEGEEYLDALMSHFSGKSNVGFCLDTGHEICYNYPNDLIAKYGDRLIATHINDNLGISRSDGKIFWTDDLHLLPFDGCVDWENFAKRLNKCLYDGILTLELVKLSRPNRHDSDKYSKLSIEEYVSEAYARACKIAFLRERFK